MKAVAEHLRSAGAAIIERVKAAVRRVADSPPAQRVRALARREPVAVFGLIVAVTGAVDEVTKGGTINTSDVWKPLAVAVGSAVVRYFVSPTATL